MKKKISRKLTGAALDWAVSKITHPEWAEDAHWYSTFWYAGIDKPVGMPYAPSTDWEQGGPIIEKARITVSFDLDTKKWVAGRYNETMAYLTGAEGKTPLIAAMRCYVASKLGDEVEMPEEITVLAHNDDPNLFVVFEAKSLRKFLGEGVKPGTIVYGTLRSNGTIFLSKEGIVGTENQGDVFCANAIESVDFKRN